MILLLWDRARLADSSVCAKLTSLAVASYLAWRHKRGIHLLIKQVNKCISQSVNPIVLLLVCVTKIFSEDCHTTIQTIIQL